MTPTPVCSVMMITEDSYAIVDPCLNLPAFPLVRGPASSVLLLLV
jgi:hypothetical protein